jgi:hypothetical protein
MPEYEDDDADIWLCNTWTLGRYVDQAVMAHNEGRAVLEEEVLMR